MVLDYALFILSIELLFFALEVAFSFFPGRKYKCNIPKTQLSLASLAFFFQAVGCLWVYIRKDEIEDGSLLSLEGCLLSLALITAVFAGSIYKFLGTKKFEKKLDLCVLSLTSNEYKLKSKFNLDLGNALYTPNINSFAICDNIVLIFSGNRPDKEIDADFYCYEIDDGVYDCVAFVDKESKISISKIILILKKFMFFISLSLLPVLIVIYDQLMLQGKNIARLIPLFRFEMLYILGSILTLLFANSEGVTRFGSWLGKVMIALSVVYVVAFFKGL